MAAQSDDTLLPPRHLRDQTCRLPDGRTLSFAEFGDTSGYPVFYFHGFPGCRLEPWQDHRMLALKRIRLICPDRPGIGGSSPQPGRRYLDYPADILVLADHLGLKRFAVLGVSGGGPYAVACARTMPEERMSAVGLLAPAAPWYIEGQDADVTKYLKTVSRMGEWAVRHMPGVVEALVKVVVGTLGWLLSKQWVLKRVDRRFERSNRDHKHDGDGQNDHDQDEPLSAVQQREQMVEIFHQQFRHGTQSVMDEATLLQQPWGFDLSGVTYDTIQIWLGSKDVNAPVQQSRLMASRLPQTDMKEFDLDHHEMLGELGMILDGLVTEKMRQAS